MDDQTEPTTEVTLEDRVAYLEWCVARLIPEDQQVYLRRLYERVQQKAADTAPTVEESKPEAAPPSDLTETAPTVS